MLKNNHSLNSTPITHIFLVGGGSGGHALPLWTIFKALQKKYAHTNTTFHVFGRKKGLEKDLFKSEKILYHPIPAGKLRRNPLLSYSNLTDFFQSFKAILICLYIFWKNKKGRGVLLSTGSYVALPVIIAASILRFPILLHEQTTRIGLTNRIGSFFAQKILLNFHEAKKFFPPAKSIVVGYPLRETFYQINPKKTTKENIKTILFTGGGNGSFLINTLVKLYLEKLLPHYKVLHQTGPKEINCFSAWKPKLKQTNRYQPIPFLSQVQWIKWLSLSNVLITRAGAGIVSESIFLQKKMILIPLKIAQKNEQFFNAKAAKNYLAKLNIPCEIVPESELPNINLLQMIKTLTQYPTTHKKNLKNPNNNATKKIVAEIDAALKSLL